MIVLIAGPSHTGKTQLAQRLLERYMLPTFSIDLLKMGLIRSGNTSLTPFSDDELTEYLWPIVREMIKTAIENKQSLIVEGCYIPFDWASELEERYLSEIRYICLVMSEKYIRAHFDDIKRYASIVEDRGADEDCTMEWLIDINAAALKGCIESGAEHILIDDEYHVDIEL